MTKPPSSLFHYPLTYRFINAVRNARDDAAVLTALLPFGIAWERTVNHYETPPEIVMTTHGLVSVAAQSHRYFPLVLAAVAFVVLRRVRPAGTRLAARTVAEYAASDVWRWIWIVSLAGCAALMPGTAPGRYGPLIGALLVAYLAGKRAERRRRFRVRKATAAGYRPSLRASWSLNGYLTLQLCGTADPDVPGWTTNLSNAFADGAAYFLRRRDIRSAAYCLTRGVEYELRNSSYAEADRLCRSAEADPRLANVPAVLTARAQYLRIVGDPVGAMECLQRAMEQQPTADLSAMIDEFSFDPDNVDGPRHGIPWSRGWQRFSAVWRRRPATALFSLVAEARATAELDPGTATVLAYRVVRLQDRIKLALPDDDVELGEWMRMHHASGLALMLAGYLFERRESLQDASQAFQEAHERLMNTAVDKRRAARCLIRAVVHALAAGYDEPRQENHALDLLRAGLHGLERFRVSLPEENSRTTWMTADNRLLELAFHALVTQIRFHRAKAAELGAWLIESLHRTAAAELITSNLLSNDPAFRTAVAEALRTDQKIVVGSEQLDEISATSSSNRAAVAAQMRTLRETVALLEVDYEAVVSALGNRIALLYHCTNDEGGWVFRTALVTPSTGATLHHAEIRPAQDDARRASFLSATGILNTIDAGDNTMALTAIFQGLELDRPVWQEIAAAIFPPNLFDALAAIAADGRVAELLVVPDGPIAGLPLPGLAVPGSDGRLLVEVAQVSMVPALSMLTQPRSREASSRRVAAVHLDHELVGATAEMVQWRQSAHLIDIRQSSGLSSLQAALDTSPRPDVAVISGYGAPGATGYDRVIRLGDRTVLSTAAALAMNWPQTVILGACWVTAMAVRSGKESSGFPMACLQRGATTVLGGIAPIGDDAASRVLAPVLSNLHRASSPAHDLRHGMLAELSLSGKLVNAAHWAAYATWTIAASESSGALVSAHWGKDSLPTTDRSSGDNLQLQRPLTGALARQLTGARVLTRGGPPGTLELLVAVFEDDPDRWSALAAALGPAPEDLFGVEATTGTVLAQIARTTMVISAELAGALLRAEKLAIHLGAADLRTEVVVLAMLLEEETRASQWVRKSGSAADQFIDVVAHQVAGPVDTDVDMAISVLMNGVAQPSESVHSELFQATDIDGKDLSPGPRSRRFTRIGATAGAALLLVATIAFARVPEQSTAAASAPAPTPPPTAATRKPQKWIGVTMASHGGGHVVLSAVIPGSPADRAGLRENDVIIEIAGGPPGSPGAVVDLIQGLPAGVELLVITRRANREIVTRVMPESR